MASRREFLLQSSKATLASLLLPFPGNTSFVSLKTNRWPIGLQLYTVGDLLKQNPKATLHKIATIGYQEIESVGVTENSLYGYKPKDFSQLLKSMGLRWRSAHVSGAPMKMSKADLYSYMKPKTHDDTLKVEAYARQVANGAGGLNLKNNDQLLVDNAAEGGVDYLVCSAIPVGTLDEIKTAVDVFNKAGETAKKAGLQFVYHNHATEFDLVEGHRPFDYIMEHTDKELVKMELDLAWATKAGQNFETLFKNYPGRYPLWHIKDIKADKTSITEVGNGIVDYKHIFPYAKSAGLKHFFVEQDLPENPLRSITTSIANLKKILA
ncbi:sugar phosphate isomerase/epimerase [Fibrella sp. HMF5335]|uniref:Sugar phosphate isomerase/epimerase n=1 Tax=Fibrella rubiginis TaxID=2817060 RepID=A0A939GEQ3_9BACT|nr:sugar phosphate isomerase/epimerase [Fibrella rubiginis]MBO0936418.1 sugar phosphate isomerase/epimerase [Fibrella rubiginis]